MEAVTVARLLTRDDPLPSNAVLVVDEAGTLGTADMRRLFKIAAPGRVVLVGDTGQHAPVAQGDALRIIEEHSGYRFGRLTQIRRQRSEQLKEIVGLAAKQETGEAFTRLQTAGEVVERHEVALLHERAATDFLKAMAAGKTALVVAPTWSEIEGVTGAIRTRMRADGKLHEEQSVKVFDSLGWTDAQKRLVDHYETGTALRFVKKTAHFRAGQTVEVVAQVGKQLRVRDWLGRERLVAPSRSPSSFDVGQKRELAVAVGDTLLLRANAAEFVNGERVQVKAVGKGGRIALVDGRTLPREYRTFTHGYAVTSHAAQGKTVDEVFVVASSQSFAAVSQEQFYVGISRARERARVYTDDAELLSRRVQDTHTRKAAVELQGLRDALAKAGFKRTVAPVRPSVSVAALAAPETRRAAVVAESARRVLRPLRKFRAERLAPLQRFVAWTRSLAALLSQRVSFAERLRESQKVREKQTPTQTPVFTNAAALPVPKQSQSRGIRIH